MKVLHVLGGLRRSGAEQMLLSAAPRFAAAGIEQQVLGLADSSESAIAERFVAAGFAVHHLPVRSRLAFPGSFFRQVRALSPDCVHIHAERLSIVTAVCARLAGVPAVRTIHANFRFEGMLRRRKVIERWLTRVVGVRFIAISPTVQANELVRFRSHCELIENWYDDRVFRPPTDRERVEARCRLGVDGQKPVIAIVGNCAPVKNHAMLFEALTFVHSRSYLVLHAGDDHGADDEHKAATALAPAHEVRFLGSRDDVRDVIWSADVFVMCSVAEGLGLAALEAAATGIRCVLTRVPGLRDILAALREQTGVGLSAIELAQALDGLTLARDAHEGPRQAEVVLQRYGIDRGVNAYLQMYGCATSHKVTSR